MYICIQVLVFENGAYGKRLGKVCEVMGVEVDVISFPENDYIDLKKVESILQGNNSYTLVAMVHCETSSGVINPVEGVGKIVKQHLPGT
jgi:aspartate aminotransferase-like enzyme